MRYARSTPGRLCLGSMVTPPSGMGSTDSSSRGRMYAHRYCISPRKRAWAAKSIPPLEARRERSALYSRTMRGRGELARHALPNARNR